MEESWNGQVKNGQFKKFVTIQRNSWKHKKAQSVTVQSALNSFILILVVY